MVEDLVPPILSLHFEGEVAKEHSVPASALVQAGQSLQRAIHLLAIAHEGKDIKERLRVGHDIERKYSVVFKVPKNGGYILPYGIGNAPAMLIDTPDVEIIIKQHLQTLDAVKNNDLLSLKKIIPLASIRRQYLAALKNMQPPKRTGLILNIEDSQNRKLIDGKAVLDTLNEMLAEPKSSTVMPRIVTGRIDALDFQARKLSLALFSGRHIDCLYSEDFEPALVENRRELIQVRGEAVLNDDDSLKALNNVTEILEIDESKIVVDQIIINDKVLKAKAPIYFDVEFDQSEGIYTAVGDYHLVLSGVTRTDLEYAIEEAFAFLWAEYVEPDCDNFTEDGKNLRQKLKLAFGAIDAA